MVEVRRTEETGDKTTGDLPVGGRRRETVEAGDPTQVTEHTHSKVSEIFNFAFLFGS